MFMNSLSLISTPGWYLVVFRKSRNNHPKKIVGQCRRWRLTTPTPKNCGYKLFYGNTGFEWFKSCKCKSLSAYHPSACHVHAVADWADPAKSKGWQLSTTLAGTTSCPRISVYAVIPWCDDRSTSARKDSHFSLEIAVIQNYSAKESWELPKNLPSSTFKIPPRSLDERVGEEEHKGNDQAVNGQGLHEGQGQQQHTSQVICHLRLTGDAVNASSGSNALANTGTDRCQANGEASANGRQGRDPHWALVSECCLWCHQSSRGQSCCSSSVCGRGRHMRAARSWHESSQECSAAQQHGTSQDEGASHGGIESDKTG